LRFEEQQVSSYNSVFHLAAMRAASVLARAMGDDVFAEECDRAFRRAQEALDLLQWVEGGAMGGHYASTSDDCTAAGCTTHIGIFGDSFYAQVLAYSLGLGDLLRNPERLDIHLQTTWRTNCVHNDVDTGKLVPGCPNGLVAMTGRPLFVPALAKPPCVTCTDLQVWEMSTHNWVTLALHRKLLAADDALQRSAGTSTSYSQLINDQWNIAGIKSNDGYPSVTSHYGYHMVFWHTVLALSGQSADLSTPGNATLSFSPRRECAAGSGYTLPVLLPSVVGVLTCTVRRFTFELTVGSLELDHLIVSGSRYPQDKTRISAGDKPLSWQKSSKTLVPAKTDDDR